MVLPLLQPASHHFCCSYEIKCAITINAFHTNHDARVLLIAELWSSAFVLSTLRGCSRGSYCSSHLRGFFAVHHVVHVGDISCWFVTWYLTSATAIGVAVLRLWEAARWYAFSIAWVSSHFSEKARRDVGVLTEVQLLGNSCYSYSVSCSVIVSLSMCFIVVRHTGDVFFPQKVSSSHFRSFLISSSPCLLSPSLLYRFYHSC